MKVITVASDLTNIGFKEFLEPSCDFYNLDATVLIHDSGSFSNPFKDVLLKKYLEGVEDDEIIFFTDSMDATFIAKEEEILNKFSSFNCELVFSAEVNCWPDKQLEEGYPGLDTHFRYLNSGGFVGRAEYIKRLYEKYPIYCTCDKPMYSWSNQYYWNLVFKAEWPNIQLDNNCEIFYTTATPIPGKIEDFLKDLQDPVIISELYNEEKKRLNYEVHSRSGRIWNKITDSIPCHIHFAGTVPKLLMEEGYFDWLKKPSINSLNDR